MTAQDNSPAFDVFIIGGGVNGCGIARDLAGRGVSVGLAEMNDLGSATSGASTKMFHGGLRYLEYFEIRLVQEALRERETLLRAMPHISWPMRFVLPYHPDMRFEGSTSVSKLLGVFLPWLKGRRPAWMIRFGLFLYDNLAGRTILQGASSLKLENTFEGAPLDPKFKRAFEYSDCWIEDSRLVVLNARDAVDRGAKVWTQTKVERAERGENGWRIELRDQITGNKTTVTSRILINAAGPWVGDVIQGVIGANSRESVRLVRGSHIVTRKLYEHDKCYFFQGKDGRIIFVIPYEQDFTLIGTTDQDHSAADVRPECTPEERDYLIDFANEYLAKDISADDVVWTYSGVRPLYDDGADSASAATREYVLKLDDQKDAVLLNIFGGKITTYRKLAQAAVDMLAPFLVNLGAEWTKGAALSGGDFAVDRVETLIAELQVDYPFLGEFWARRLFRAYGNNARKILGNAKQADALGADFGATLSEAEVRWQIENEFARTAQDVIWRRTKLGLRLNTEQVARLQDWMNNFSG